MNNPKIEVSFTYYSKEGGQYEVHAWAEEDFNDFDLMAIDVNGHYVVPERHMIIEAQKYLERQVRLEGLYK